MKLGNKIGKIFSDETLGVVSRKPDTPPPKPAKKPTMVSQPQAAKPAVKAASEKPQPPKTISIKDQLSDMFDESYGPVKNGNHAILDVLNIPRTRIPPLAEHDKFIKETVFQISTPAGFDTDAVSNYCDRVEWVYEEITQLFREKEKDFSKLLEEVTRLESSIIKKAQQSEMQAFQMSRTKEDELQEKLIDAHETISRIREENEELKNKLLQYTSSQRLQTTLQTPQDIADTSDIKPVGGCIPQRPKQNSFAGADLGAMMASFQVGEECDE